MLEIQDINIMHFNLSKTRLCNAMAALPLPLALCANSKCLQTPSEKISLNEEYLFVHAANTLMEKEIQKKNHLLLLHPPPPLMSLQYLANPQHPQQEEKKVTLKYLRHHLQMLLRKVV